MYYGRHSSDDDADVAGCFALFGCVVMLLLIGASLGANLGRAVERGIIQTEAVKRGKGEWVVSPAGYTTFKWKEEAPTE